MICPGQTRIRADHLVTLIPALSRSDVRCFFSITAKLKCTLLRIVFRDELAFQSAAARHCPPEEVRVVMSEVTGGCAHSYTARTLPLTSAQTHRRARTSAIWRRLQMRACVYAAELDGERLFDCYLVCFNSLALLLKCCLTVASPPSTQTCHASRRNRGKEARLEMICWRRSWFLHKPMRSYGMVFSVEATRGSITMQALFLLHDSPSTWIWNDEIFYI